MAKNEQRYPSRDEAKRLFMESPFYSWREFCRDKGWNWESARRKYPVPSWIAEKCKIQQEHFGAEVEGLMSEMSELWHVQSHKTLRDYPRRIDVMASLLDVRMKAFLDKAKADEAKGTSTFTTVPTVELRQLATAVKMITDAKYEALLLTKLQVKEFERPVDGSEDGSITFKIAGGSSPKALQKIWEDWNDK